MPMDARLLLGSLGFSSKDWMNPFTSAFMMPKRWASSQGTCSTAMVAAAFLSRWNFSILA